MDYSDLLFWMIAIPTFWSFIAVVRHRRSAEGWLLVTFTILLTLFFAWLRRSNALLYAAAVLWALFVFIPSLLSRRCNNRLVQQDYAAAARLARAIRILHPFDGWREHPKILDALQLAQSGDIAGAREILNQFRHLTSHSAHTAMINLYRLTNQWEEFLAWARQISTRLDDNASMIPILLRARAETGDLVGMIDLYHQNKNAIAKLSPASNREFARLMLFAFSGRRDLVERLFTGALDLLPETTKTFWRATTDQAAGNIDAAREKLDALSPSADPLLRHAIQRRLAYPLTPSTSLDPARLKVIEAAAIEHGHEQVFHATPPLFSPAAQATRILILLNLGMFGLEVVSGGATNGQVLYKLGAMSPPDVLLGQWWRLGAALFLHYGAPHIFMNMLALWALGPFVEFAFGALKYLAIYFIAGIGSMLMVMALTPQQNTVGASGAILGLVGATGGLMLKGWLRERAQPAKRRLTSILTIVALQTFMDAMIPQISMTAHLSGAVLGFATALIIPNKLVRGSIKD